MLRRPLVSHLEAGEAASPPPPPPPLWPEEERSHVVRPQCQRASSAPPQGRITSVFQETCHKCSGSTSPPQNHAEPKSNAGGAGERLTYDLFTSERRNARVCARESTALIANVLTLPQRSEV